MTLAGAGDDMREFVPRNAVQAYGISGFFFHQDCRRFRPICGNLYLEMMQSWSIGHFEVRVSGFINGISSLGFWRLSRAPIASDLTTSGLRFRRTSLGLLLPQIFTP